MRAWMLVAAMAVGCGAPSTYLAAETEDAGRVGVVPTMDVRAEDGGVTEDAPETRDVVTVADAGQTGDAGADVTGDAGVDAATDSGAMADSGMADAGAEDVGAVDAGTPDAGSDAIADAGSVVADAGVSDAGAPDARNPCADGNPCTIPFYVGGGCSYEAVVAPCCADGTWVCDGGAGAISP